MNNNNNQSNLGFTLKFGNDRKPSLEFGIIDSNPIAPYNPNNNIKLYDSKDKYNHIPSTEVIMDSNLTQPFTYQDSNITAKEIINKDNTSTLVIESKTNLLEYQGNTADTLMTGISAMFASMATLAEKYGVDKSLKESTKGLGAKGRILASVLFQTRGFYETL